jgi:nickel transport protein
MLWSSYAALALSLLGQAGSTTAKLTEEQVLDRLRPIPVFLALGDGGAPVTATRDGKASIGVFFRKAECDAFVTALKSKPNFSAVSTVPISLADLFANRAKMATLAYQSIPGERAKALALAKVDKPALKEFNSVALFYVATKKGAYVTISQGSEMRVPLFFSSEEAAAFQKRAIQASTAADAQLRVTTLESVMNLLQTGPAKETLQILLVPHRDALADLQTGSDKTP